MKKVLLATLALACFGSASLDAQQIGTPGYVQRHPARTSNPAMTPQNGNDTLNNVYANTQCGLNYTQATQRLGQRSNLNGVPQPASFVISGIPACAVIDRAFLWTEVLGTNPIPVTANILNPVGGTASYPMTHAGSSVDVCWGMNGTHVYRADVTGSITGNGTYSIGGLPTSISNSSYDAEGATLMVIYSDPTASYTGSLQIDDGSHTVQGGSLTHQMTGFTACANSTSASAFMMVGDMQLNGYTITMNGGPNVPTTWNWWNYITTNTSVTNGQSSCNYSLTSAGDCYTLAVAGLYYQTACSSCTPTTSPMTVSTSVTPDMCSGNGTATVSVSGGTAPYTYTWYTNPPQSGTTATGLTAGVYQVQVTDANGACAGATVTIPYGGPVVSITGTQSNCNPTGTATANVTGGISPYSYSWTTSPVQTTQTATNLSSGSYSVTVTDAGGCVTTSSVVISQASPLTVGLSATPATGCLSNSAADGSIAVTAVNYGTPPYTYSWSTVPVQTNDTAFNLMQGTYTVTVTDANGCTGSAAATVTLAPGFTVHTVSTSAPCGGTGTATVDTIYGGTPPYTYNWNSTPPQTTATATNLPPGSYYVTVTDGSGCSYNANASITTQVSFSIATSSTPASYCLSTSASDGTILCTVTGNTGPYTYLWNTSPQQTTASVSNAMAGNYTVYVTDAGGCTDSAMVNVGSAPTLALSFTTVGAPCNGTGSATVSVSGGAAPYSYLWSTTPAQTSPTASGLPPGTYSVTVTDASGCANTGIVQVGSLNPVIVSLTTTPASCNGVGSATVTASGGTAPYSYLWNTTPAQTTATAYGLVPGTYAVTVTDASGCSTTDSAYVGSVGYVYAYAYQIPTSCNVQPMAQVIAIGGVAPYTYAWNTTPVQTTDTAFNLAPGVYTATVTDANGCQGISAPVTISNTPFQLQTSGAQSSTCASGASLWALSSDTSATFTWQPGSLSGQSVWVNPLTTTTYTVTATASCGSVTDTLTVFVTPGNTSGENICSVTVDTAANKYKVIWERFSPIVSGTYNIYKETPPNSNTYVLIASQPVVQFTTYTDPASNPSTGADRYKLSTTDTCGNTSPVSLHHRPVFLTVSPGNPSGWDLAWTAYEGYAPWGYDVYRGTSLNSMTYQGSVSGSTLMYSDPSAPSGTLYYMVEASNTILCVPSRVSSTLLTERDHSLSNIVSTNPQGIAETPSLAGVVISPNPSDGSFMLTFGGSSSEVFQLEIFNAIGQVVYAQQLNAVAATNHAQLDLRQLAAGVYSLRLRSDKTSVTRKIVIRR